MGRLARGTSLVVLCGVLMACDATTAVEHTASGREHLAAGEIRAAVIELKNALQKDPDLAEARMLLGEANYRLGDYGGAAKEFERALDLGMDNDRVHLGLLRSKVRLGLYQEVIGALEDRGALTPDYAVILADAYLIAGDPERAGALYRQAEGLSRGNLGLGVIALQQGDLERAGQHFSRAVEQDPENWEAWLRLADYQVSRRAFDDAEDAYTKAAELQGARVMGRVGLARVDLLRGDLDAARKDVDDLLRLAPNFALAHYLDGLIRFQDEDLSGAEEAIREVQSAAPDHPPSLYLMGAIKYRQGMYSQAENNLRRYLAQDPENESAAKLLGSTRFAEGNFRGTVETLAPFVPATEDAQLLAMYGSAELRLGNPGPASAALERAVSLAPDMTAFRNQLALSLLASGDREGAEAELKSAIDVDAGQFESDYLLAMVRLRDGDWDSADEAVDAIIHKSPDSPIGYNLRGAVALGREDQDAARAAFREALDRDPSFLPAVQNLARLDETAGNRGEAAARYQAFLKSHPDHEGALIALAEVSLRGGDQAAAARYFEQSFEAHPESVRSALGLGRLYLAAGRLVDAGRVVDQALARTPDFPDLLLLKAQVHLRSGENEAAEDVATHLQTMLTDDERGNAMRLAVGQLQAQLGKLALARSNLEQVLETSDGGQPGVLRTLARLDLAEGHVDRAGERVEQLVKLAPDDADTRLLQGDLLMAQNQPDKAREIYAELAGSGVRDGVIRMATLSMAGGDMQGAVRRLDDWLEQYPGDLGARILAADALMRVDVGRALERYEGLADTGNPVVLNNLAWLYMERGDSRAADTARRAVEQAPNNPDILDTLGWVLLNDGETDEALRMLRRSVQLNPDNPSVQYHLGMALRAAGDGDGARAALSRALEKEGFPEAADARKALAEL